MASEERQVNGHGPSNGVQQALPESTAGLPAERLRCVLRKLRDLNLSGERITVDAETSVVVDGCTSLDQSPERTLRYRIRVEGSEPESLEITLGDGDLRVERHTSAAQRITVRHLRLEGGADGPATSPDLHVRLDPEHAGSRDVERFLRRVVRVVYRAADPPSDDVG